MCGVLACILCEEHTLLFAAPTTCVCVRAGLIYLRSDGRTKKGTNFSNIRVFAEYPLRLGWRVGWDNMYVTIKVLEQSNVSQSKANPSHEKSAKKKMA